MWMTSGNQCRVEDSRHGKGGERVKMERRKEGRKVDERLVVDGKRWSSLALVQSHCYSLLTGVRSCLIGVM